MQYRASNVPILAFRHWAHTGPVKAQFWADSGIRYWPSTAPYCIFVLAQNRIAGTGPIPLPSLAQYRTGTGVFAGLVI